MNAKTSVLELVQGLPDDVSIDDIQYHLYVREKISKSVESVERGKTYSHEDVAQMIASWRK